ncbi:MAG: amidase [Bacteroidetes bacterium]|nr:amidase [Bacteroidota bacterium]
METKNGFNLMTPAEFESWITAQNVARTILYVQQHHTYIPNYAHFNGSNHFTLQQGMKNSHVALGWVDVAQHFSIFPDGKICTGRSLEWNPAGIYGFNSYAICIENVGYFDTGNDTMNAAQADSIVRVTAALCKRFGIPVNEDRIVYHHWFDLNNGARTNGSGVTKTCPGTGFFGGNTVAAAKANFYPKVQAILQGSGPAAQPPAVLKYGCVNTNVLNVRTTASSSSPVTNTVRLGSVIRIYEEKNGWYRISASRQEWVYASYVKIVKRATVNADVLNVRSGPGTNFNKMAEVRKNEEVFVYDEQNDWCKISLDERWVSKAYLTF